jgi:ribonuclease VapC
MFDAALAIVRERKLKPTAAHAIVRDLADRLAINYEAEAIPHAIAARERFGAGRRGLNMGDCLSYGAAKQGRAPALCRRGFPADRRQRSCLIGLFAAFSWTVRAA